jgi:putative ABC transport system permease protein
MPALKQFGFGLLLLLVVAVPAALLLVLPVWLLLASFGLLAAWMSVTRMGQQASALAAISIATLPRRLSSSSVIVVGIAGVVGVLVALLAMAAGFEATLKQTGTDDTAIVMSSGARSEIQSALNRDMVATITQVPQVLQNAQGQPMVSTEIVVAASFPKKHGGADANVEIRGVAERVWDLRPNVKITAGRKLKPGLNELLVGARVHERFAGTEVGSTQQMRGQKWAIVGIFDSGDAFNSEIWGDADVISSAFHRESSPTSMTVQLTQAQAFDAFRKGIAGDRRLKVDVQTTRQYYAGQSAGLTPLIRMLGTTVGAIMAIGAIFGAVNTMYAAIATRGREIAVLRAIGFHGGPVVLSVLLETMLLAAFGGTLGAAIAWAIFDGFTASTMGIIFAFKVSPALLWNGLKWALAIGLVGGVFPAFRAARAPIISGLREL